MKKCNPEMASLTLIEWQFFCTLTFKKSRVAERIRLSMFFAAMRLMARDYGLHFKRVLWVLRREEGESFGRVHYHALIAGFPSWARKVATAQAIEARWRRMGGGHPVVTVYNSTLDGVDYILKRGDELAGSLATRYAGDYHETQKFGGSCDVMLSESILNTLQGRRSYRTRAASSYRQSEVIVSPRSTVTAPATVHTC